jgi:hypothetical protein
MANRYFCENVMTRLLVLAAGLFLLLGGPAFATCTEVNVTGVQAINVPASDAGPSIFGTTSGAQSFRAPGATGACFFWRETTFRLKQFGAPGSLTITANSGAVPGSTALLGTTSLASASTTDYLDRTAAFAAPVQITAGSDYTVIASAPGGTAADYYKLGLQPGNPYSNGQYCFWNGATWDCTSNTDLRLAICIESCSVNTGCVRTQGYWKNHSEAWPVASLELGTVSYTKAQLLTILGTPVRGNGLISLAHQLIAAKLNLLNGAAVPLAIQDAIADADNLIGNLVVPPIGGGSLSTSSTSALINALDQYNNGLTPGGPTHCGD